MSKKAGIMPWKKVCVLRKEIRERELTPADFAVDLPQGRKRRKRRNPLLLPPGAVLCHYIRNRKPAGVLLRRVASHVEKKGRRVDHQCGPDLRRRQVAHLVRTLLFDNPGRQSSKKRESGKANPEPRRNQGSPEGTCRGPCPLTRFDWKRGGEVRSPEGEVRRFRMPWNLIAWQLLGEEGP